MGFAIKVLCGEKKIETTTTKKKQNKLQSEKKKTKTNRR